MMLLKKPQSTVHEFPFAYSMALVLDGPNMSFSPVRSMKRSLTLERPNAGSTRTDQREDLHT